MPKLRVILCDQLSLSISSLKDLSESDVVLLCETKDEFTYIKHHKKKIAFQLSCMRHFKKELDTLTCKIVYVRLDDPHNSQCLITEIKKAYDIHNAEEIIVTWPCDYRLLDKFQNLSTHYPVLILEDKRFLMSKEEFEKWSYEKKELRMEFMYRLLRKKYNILMENNEPVGGQWNYDQENRKSPPSNLNVPQPFQLEPDSISLEVIALIDREFADHFGDLMPFYFAVTREQALAVFENFIQHRLPSFGLYQDAMIEGEAWMFHSHISFYINNGLLDPLECIKRVESAYYIDYIPLNAAEGFIRQVIGWREYVRGIYWLKMPEYKNRNFLNASRSLPQFFWDTQTKMNCLKQCITETKQNAYAHHIQRLMVIGNFCLITGMSPDEVNEWFMIVYADAYEWVELPNVTGMILHADGGYLGSKPYAASGAYIQKMSNYCDKCHYKVKLKTGEQACPFNYLYWNFILMHETKFSKNPRMKMIYSVADKMTQDRKSEIALDAEKFLNSI
ncbi:MAG: cryptochrome/photolyase family protein [Candidatus Puniceispirillum sp.]|nr:cryptochrome/photolyase family protein [Candidatus Pelagibacter sp.]MBA4283241.1 cryptochrome/photolyase family protein [Candidatus Puniceispirillum sp.]